MDGNDVIRALKKKLQVKTDHDLAFSLGVTYQSIQNWTKRSVVTARQLAGLIHKARQEAINNTQRNAIRPLVEFFRIQQNEATRGRKFSLLDVNDRKGTPHPYRAGLKDELDKHCGVYIFFDSRGQAIYAGKARRQSLWKEMTLAFNRKRGSVQKIKRVRHPENRIVYRTSEEKSRQIHGYSVPLYELAAYFSAYHVADGMIDELESFLMRSFANDLLNIKMEKFGRQHRRNLQSSLTG